MGGWAQPNRDTLKWDGTLVINTALQCPWIDGNINIARPSIFSQYLGFVCDGSSNIISSNGSNKSFVLNQLAGNDINIQMASVNIATFKTTGKLGVGTSGPDQILTIASSATVAASIGIARSDSLTSPTIDLTISSGSLYVSNGHLFYKGAAGTVTRVAAS